MRVQKWAHATTRTCWNAQPARSAQMPGVERGAGSRKASRSARFVSASTADNNALISAVPRTDRSR